MKTTRKTTTKDRPNEAARKPDWVVKTPRSFGTGNRFERIGAAWSREDQGICIRLNGKQVIDADLYLYPAEREAAAGGAQ